MTALSLHSLQVAGLRLIASLSCLTIAAIGPKRVPHVLQIKVWKQSRYC